MGKADTGLSQQVLNSYKVGGRLHRQGSEVTVREVSGVCESAKGKTQTGLRLSKERGKAV